MYLFYEHHKTPEGAVSVTELKLSSHKDHWRIDWRNPAEKAKMDIITVLLKHPPVAKRMTDGQTWIWTYFEDWGTKTISKIEETLKPLGGVLLIEVEDLAKLATEQGRFDLSKRAKPIDPKDFFYNTTPATAGAPSAEEIQQKLAALLSVEAKVLSSSENGELKKLYRAATLRFHPDRSGGDAAKMSELNMLWRMYNG